MFDSVAFFAGLVQSLEQAMGQKAFAAMIRDIRSAEPSIANGPDVPVLRMWQRFLGAEESEESIHKTLEAIAGTVSRSTFEVYQYLSAFSGGASAVLAGGICGATPNCADCYLARMCAYHNAPSGKQRQRPFTLSQRMAREGAASLSDVDLLSLLLGGASPNKKHRASAADLLERYGTVRALASAELSELQTLKSMTAAGATRIAAFSALRQRASGEDRLLQGQIHCANDLHSMFQANLRDAKKECFLVVLLDQKNRVMKWEQVSEGTLTASLVHPREALGPALRHSAAAVAFVHNHPSGDPSPSRQDKVVTTQLQDSAQMLGIRMLDHVILGDGRYFSFAEEGLLN